MATVPRPPLTVRREPASGFGAQVSSGSVGSSLSTTSQTNASVTTRGLNYWKREVQSYHAALATAGCVASLILTTLGVPLPPGPRDQGAQLPPRGYARSVALLTHHNGPALLFTLKSKDFFFGLGGPDYDWPNPIGTRVNSARFRTPDHLTITAGLLPELFGKDMFFGLGGPDYDWPNPQRPVWNTSLHQSLPTNPNLYPSGPIQPPFVPMEFPNPRAAGRPIDGRTWIDTLLPSLNGQDVMFGPPGMGADYDWPNPGRPVWSRGLYQSYGTPVTLLSLRPQMRPDLMPPRAPARPNSALTWIDTLLPNLSGKDTFFGLAGSPNFDWPNPRGYARSVELLTWAPQVSPLLTTPPPTVRPVPTSDFPNPRGPVWPRPPGVWRPAGPPPVPPTFPVFWPKPITLPDRTALYPFYVNNNGRLLFDPPPLRQSDWPNPQRLSPACIANRDGSLSSPLTIRSLTIGVLLVVDLVSPASREIDFVSVASRVENWASAASRVVNFNSDEDPEVF